MIPQSLLVILAVSALITSIVSAIGKCPLWVSVFLVAFVLTLLVWK